MITDFFLNFAFNIADFFLGGIESIEIAINSAAINGFLDIVATGLFFLPWAQLLPILGIIVALQSFRIIVSTIKTIWNLLPFM